jgi:uncharacterized protein
LERIVLAMVATHPDGRAEAMQTFAKSPRYEVRAACGRRWTAVLGAVLLLFGLVPVAAQANSTAQNLPFSQNWSDIGLISVNDDWSLVPGIDGFLGQDLTTATGTDPQTLLGSSVVVNDLDVIANQTNTSIGNGGVAEFQIADPVIALNGSGTADAPNIVLTLNTSGANAVAVSYSLRDLDGSADNSVQPVAVQYRVGNSGDFTNIAAGFVPDATSGPSLATLVTPVAVTLPANADNQPVVQVRVITANAAGNDEWVGIDNISVSAGSSSDAAPTVVSTTPANSATGVAVDSDVTVTFSEPVAAAADAFGVVCATSGAAAVTVTGGPTAWVVNPGANFAGNESCTLTVDASLVTDVDANDPPDAMSANYVGSFTTGAVDPCAGAITPIFTIQGSGASATTTGVITTKGVVIGDYEYPGVGATGGFLRGFYLQDATGDGDPATSDGIFVFNASLNSVELGDVVLVTGTVAEFQNQTQIGSVTSLVKCGTGAVTPTDVTLPSASPTSLEAVEGMLVRTPQTLTVTEHFQLGRFGQVVVSSGGRLSQPTNVTTPGAAALALQASNNLNRLIIDDASQAQNPDPIVFGRNGNPLSASNTLRGGDTTTGAVGVMTYTFGGNAVSPNAYRLRPFNALGGNVQFVEGNARPANVAVPGTLRAAGLNLLNFFNTFDGLPDAVDNCTNGVGGAATDCRGADTQAEFDRQWPKTVAAINSLAADVVGLIEIENDGYGADSSLKFLVDRLNASTAPGTYAYIDVDANTGQVNALGTDAIKVALVYKPSAVRPVGQTAALNTAAFVNGGDGAPRNRASLTQAFEQVSDGARFVVNVNHFKSKGSACDAPDAGDGQGNCNIVRANAASQLSAWLATDPTGVGDPDILILGDLNSYAKEDPITSLVASGYTNLVESRIGASAYSYVFDGQWGYLDYALSSASMNAQVAGVAEYHINADEPSVIDYNTDFKTANLQSTLYAPDQFRVSDHDPIVVGLNLTRPNSAPTVNAGGPYTVAEGGSVSLTAIGADPDETDPATSTLTYDWDLDNDGTFETSGATVAFSASGLDGPSSREVRVRVTDGPGLTATATATVNVANVAPTGTLTAPATAFAGIGFSVSVSNPTDPSPADVSAGLSYSFDCGTGVGFGPFGSSSSTTCAKAGTGPVTVRAIIRDKDGARTEYSATVTVSVTYQSLCTLTRSVVSRQNVADSLCAKLVLAEAFAARGWSPQLILTAYRVQVLTQVRRSITSSDAQLLISLSYRL